MTTESYYEPGGPGTAGAGFRADPPPIPAPREAPDPAEPGHRIPIRPHPVTTTRSNR